MPSALRLALLALLVAPVVACSASPQLADEPVPPSYWGGTEPPVVCLSADVAASDFDFAARVWAARADCDAPGAFPVGVRDMPGNTLGQAWLGESPVEVWLDPSAWDHHPDVTLAHEVGHALGLPHTTTGGACHLMAPFLVDACTHQDVAGRRYAVTP
jgi:hypothetical protein